MLNHMQEPARHSPRHLRPSLGLLAALVFGLANPALAWSDCGMDPAPGEVVSDELIDTRLETAYLFNPQLSQFAIDTEVAGGAVVLTGTVRSGVDWTLAEEIARSVEGVVSVSNQLEIRPEVLHGNDADPERPFGQKVMDATTTAQVRARLLANDNVAGDAILVKTENSIVRLSGRVRSDSERQLAEYITLNTAGVAAVMNELQVTSSG